MWKNLSDSILYCCKSKLYIFLIFALDIVLCILVLDSSFPIQTDVHCSIEVLDNKRAPLSVYLSRDDKWRLKTTTEMVSPQFLKMLIEKEDRWFYYHPGINPLAIARALFSNLKSNKRISGASTITMQTIRLLYPAPRTWLNKLKEAIRALQLEVHLSKDEILDLYLSKLPYGGNIEGVRAASHIFFHQQPNALSISQSALLCIIPNRPTSLKPSRIGNNTALFDARNHFLLQMYKAGIISFNEMKNAQGESIHISRYKFEQKAPHFCRKLTQLYSGQHVIYSNLDYSLQKKCESLVSHHIHKLNSIGVTNAAVVVVENKTRNVITYIGSADYHADVVAGQCDGAQAYRSPGSTLKPLLLALAIDKGIVTPASVIPDVPVTFTGYAPQNFDHNYRGRVNLDFALTHSLNIPFVRLLYLYGSEQFIANLSKYGFTEVQEQKHKLGLSVVLGGCGARLVELAALYAAFADSGFYQPLQYIHRDDLNTINRISMVSPASSYIITQILSKIERPDLPNLPEFTRTYPKVAWKTGTSFARKDAWAIGYNKEYTVAVWAGNFDGTGSAELNGARAATPLMLKIFSILPTNDKSNLEFNKPKTLLNRQFCAITGMLPNSYCKDFVTHYAIKGVTRSSTCNHLIQYYTDPFHSFSYCKSCLPTNGYVKSYYDNMEPELAAWYRQQKVTWNAPPKHNPQCRDVTKHSKLTIVFPTHESSYYLRTNSPLSFECTHSSPNSTVNWFINGKFVACISAQQALQKILPPGKHQVYCTSNGINSNVVHFSIINP